MRSEGDRADVPKGERRGEDWVQGEVKRMKQALRE